MLEYVLGIYNIDTIIDNGMRRSVLPASNPPASPSFPKRNNHVIRLVRPERNLPDFENILFKVIPNRELYEYRSNLELYKVATASCIILGHSIR